MLPGEGEAKGLAAACSTRAQEVAGGPTTCCEKDQSEMALPVQLVLPEAGKQARGSPGPVSAG